MLLLGSIVALVVSFYLLAQVSDKYFIESLDKIAHRFNMSHDMAGATLMAIGSSAPELFVAIIALVKPGDHGEIGIGTIVGSAVFNILGIIGAVAVVRKSVLAWQPVLRDLIFYSISIITLIVVFYDSQIELYEGAILIFIYGFYLLAVSRWRKWFPYEELDTIEEEEEGEGEEEAPVWEKVFRPFDYAIDKLFPPIRYYYGVFFISIIVIALLSWVLVESAVIISEMLNIPKVVIALTVLAIGTSVPDLMSSVIVAKQGRGGMALSNAVGSNIFDILICLGLPWLLIISFSKTPLPVKTDDLFVSVILLFSSVLIILALLVINNWSIGKKAGIFLLLLYLAYVIREFYLAI